MNFDNQYPIILASASPRRQELLASLGFPFRVIPSTKEEPNPADFESPIAYVTEAAEQKARDIAQDHPESVVIGADTIVVLDDEILTKPTDTRQAVDYLNRLSGRTHEVITGVTIIEGERVLPFFERTEVTFRTVPDSWINGYTATGDPYDKAGGYGIQSGAKIFVEKINGDYNNVVGLPISHLAYVLDRYGYISAKGIDAG